MDGYLSGQQLERWQEVQRVDKYLKGLLVEAAWAAARTKGAYLSAKYDSMAARKGRKKTLLIIGHKILKAAYIVLTASTRWRGSKSDVTRSV